MRTVHGPLSKAEIDDWYADGLPEQGPWVRAGFITSLDGRATGPGGLSRSLNEDSDGDHAAFQGIRRWAEVVVVAAGTAEAEGYEPLRSTPLIVVTRDGEVPPGLEETEGDDDHGPVVVVDGGEADVIPEQVLAEATRRGWRRIALEGGPTLLQQWLEHDAVDELCLTVRPVLVGGDGPMVVPTGTTLPGMRGRPSHLVVWDDDLLLRTRLRD